MPSVLQLNDCARVAENLVAAAARAGLDWDYLPPGQVRPPAGTDLSGLRRARYVPYVARRARHLHRADVVHVHYATSVRLVRERLMPRRPYLLHLHGTDIREQWPDPRFHDEIQRAVDGASAVYYTGLDTAHNAVTARPDAQFMPAFVADVPPWRPPGRGRIRFASRWGAEKGLAGQLELARALRRLPDVELEGLRWGAGADEAIAAGVQLVVPMPHEEYLDWLAGADLVVGQATGIVAVSELEAMAIGAPVAAPGRRLAYPDGTAPPVLEGTVADVVEQVRLALDDPPTTAARLGAQAWTLAHCVADPYVPGLVAQYEAAAAQLA
ncbi:MAG: hypothetical protein ACTMIR_03460 [Cellulomonadaceae bacterium]